VVLLHLREILNNHKKTFKTKLIDSFAIKYSISTGEVINQFDATIEDLLRTRYFHPELAVDTICGVEKPVIVNIMQDRQREDTCSICQANESNIQAVDEIYGERISIFEISDQNPAGALYHILFQDETGVDKKLPLTAVIFNGDVKRVWAGKAVDKSVYISLMNRFSP
jgi:hypothetical protein